MNLYSETKNRLMKNFSSRNAAIAAIVAFSVVVVGNTLFNSYAAGPTAGLEAEQGNLAGNAKVVVDTEASGGKALQFQAPTTPPPSDGGNSPMACTTRLASDGNLAAAIARLEAGDVLCLASGATYTTSLSLHGPSGTATNPIVITSDDSSHRATIKGRIVTFPGANYLTFSNLILNGNGPGRGLPSPTIGSDYVSLIGNDITNDHTGICVSPIDSGSQYGTAHHTLIHGNRIHDCGRLPATNHDHGIYNIGYDTVITDNYIYDNADRGVQLRGSQHAIVEYNVIDGNGEGVIFGDLHASNNEVAYNIITNSKIRWNAESFWGDGGIGSGNSLHHNCLWTTRSGQYASNQSIAPSMQGVAVYDNIFANPRYVNATAHDYRLAAGSPCSAMGPRH